MFVIQYLEDSPDLPDLKKSAVVEQLRAAVERLPISHLLIGWHLPASLLEACRREAERLGLRFLRWQPLLTTDKELAAQVSWQIQGIGGQKVGGYRGLPEFTFFCPNHPAVQEAVLKHIETLVHDGIYQGFFLDRLRFPSPTQDPLNDLACFCEHCCRKAALAGLDLLEIREIFFRLVRTESGRKSFIKALFSRDVLSEELDQNPALSLFLAFRCRCICDFLTLIAKPIREASLEIGLDCFSPTLTNMVGQDLKTLSRQVSWIKLMTYAHTNAPAGIPYELSGFVHFLTKTTHFEESQALKWLGESCGLTLRPSCQALEWEGITSSDLEQEVRCGVDATSVPILAGIELVDMPAVAHLGTAQISADLIAIKRAGPAGLAISWDLRHIPIKQLELVAQVYQTNDSG
jgi:hypothetical protein